LDDLLHGLGFEDDQIDSDAGALSGGWKKAPGHAGGSERWKPVCRIGIIRKIGWS
jgi:hypothetical protein